ncbi:MAG: macro domain-containing protein [Candidatus Kapaibacterium sp.]
MIRYTKGNLLDAPTQALVNTVNTVGVMGKGIALLFKEAFPENYREYVRTCKRGELVPGKLLLVREHTLNGDRIIINFPTKKEWYQKSSYSYIESGLKELLRIIESETIGSIALPPLGCGNGGLQWDRVKELIEKYLSTSSAEILVFEPQESVRATLAVTDRNVKLTPARAMIAYALFRYESKGEFSSLFAANKLAYFLQRMGEKLKLDFKPNYYGPYSPKVAHVLYLINGKFLTGLEEKDAKPFEILHLNYDAYSELEKYIRNELTCEQQSRLTNLEKLIEGFDSTLALETLSSVDFILNGNPSYSSEEVYDAISNWSPRKKTLIKPVFVNQAIQRLKEYNQDIHFGE